MGVILGKFLTLMSFLKSNRQLQVILIQVQIIYFPQYSAKWGYPHPTISCIKKTVPCYLQAQVKIMHCPKTSFSDISVLHKMLLVPIGQILSSVVPVYTHFWLCSQGKITLIFGQEQAVITKPGEQHNGRTCRHWGLLVTIFFAYAAPSLHFIN